MTKDFCDCCEKEIKRNFVTQRLKITKKIGKKEVSIEVIVALDGTWNDGHICENCLMKSFT